MKRLTVDTTLTFCDIAQCSSTQGGSNCEDGYCDQRRVYERLREYERTGLEPEEVVALKEAGQKRKEGCEFCKVELRHFPYVVAHADYASSRTIYTPNFCPMCARDLRGDNHGI